MLDIKICETSQQLSCIQKNTKPERKKLNRYIAFKNGRGINHAYIINIYRR